MADAVRQIPGLLGLHEHVVTRVTRTFTGGTVGRGAYTDVSTVLKNGSQNVHARLADDDAISQFFGSGCQWHDGDYLVGPITPNVIYTAASFDVAVSTASRIHYTISGAGIGTENGTFLAVERNFSRPFRWMLLLRRTEYGT
jgi:hypothetical protein